MVLSLERWKGKVAIVTGASAGIGAALVEKLAEEGLQVVGVARRSDRVEKLAKKLKDKPGKIHAVKADVTKEKDILKAFKYAEKLGPVHILVNNAGLIHPTTLAAGDTAKWKNTLDTNVLGLCIATREAVKSMQAHKVDGHIIHINSVVGHGVPNIPGANVYPATKHAVTALTETLRQELNQLGLKIKITSVSPGAVSTEFVQANKFTSGSLSAEEHAKWPRLESVDVVDSVIYALSTPPHVQVHELIIKPVGEAF